MDRQIIYPGSIPLDTDILYLQRNVMTTLGALAQAILGTGGVADGMACAPGPADYAVSVGPGSFTVLLQVDGTPFGSLAADPTPLVRTGLHLGTTTLQLAPPPDSGNVGCYLVQAQMQESDTGPIALPYWNAANPQVPFTGPQNSGLTQNTRREMRVVLGIKGSVQPGVSGTVPDPDAGWTGLYGVTTRAGQPVIAQSDISPVSAAAFLRFKLPAMPPGYSQQAAFSAGGVWRAPVGVRWARVRVLGGGGGGGGDVSFSGGGGGAGGYAEAVVPVVPLNLYAVTVGAGGSAASTGFTGGSGATSDFGGVVTASGGAGGGSANPDSHGGNPGFGQAGGILMPGGFGGDGAMIGKVPAGNGGASALGGGGRGANQGGAPAVGLAAGAGGGGGYGASSPGGAGAGGLVIIEF